MRADATSRVTLGSIAWRTWGGETVVYVDKTAETHWLSVEAGEVLQILLRDLQRSAASALSADAYVAIDDAGAPGKANEAHQFEATLAEFERIGIAVRQSS